MQQAAMVICLPLFLHAKEIDHTPLSLAKRDYESSMLYVKQTPPSLISQLNNAIIVYLLRAIESR